jgi:uncharacterized NAD(P)/FAD-binding protein YdhS
MNFSPLSEYHVAIIGGGASGTLLAVQLLSRVPAGTRVALIERGTRVGRGVAYGVESDDLLLNVPAGRMGAFPERPGHFLEWVRAHAGERGFPAQASAGDFLPRRLFGAYLEAVLAEARAAADGVEFHVVHGTAVDIEENAAGGRVFLEDGRELQATRVILALGNLPGAYPIPRPLPIYHSPAYVHIPWQRDALQGLASDDDVLLVGQGLTATDLIVQLARRGHRGTIHALSRRGQRPQVHGASGPFTSFLAHEPNPPTVRAMVGRVRREIRAAATAGTDWRAVVDSLRGHTPEVWQSWSWEERARFLRHVRPFWEACRHRVAPRLAEIVAAMEASGRLQFHAGRLQVLERDANGVHALFRRRGTIQHVDLRVARVINCSGPRTDYSKYQHPLFIHLLARGLIDHDPLALGISALPTGEVLRYHGDAVGWLFTLGAPLKGVLWETTAIPEIRAQARALAVRLWPAEATVPC